MKKTSNFVSIVHHCTKYEILLLLRSAPGHHKVIQSVIYQHGHWINLNQNQKFNPFFALTKYSHSETVVTYDLICIGT